MSDFFVLRICKMTKSVLICEKKPWLKYIKYSQIANNCKKNQK